MKNKQTTEEIENEFLSLEDENQIETQSETQTPEPEPEPQQPEPQPEPQVIEVVEPTEPEPEEPTKGKRGRKAGGKNKPKETIDSPESTISEPTEPEQPKTDENEEIKKEIFGKKKEKAKEQTPPVEPPKQLFSVSGEMLLGAIDFTAPLIITAIGGMVDKDIKKIKVENLQLEEIEKKTLLPAAEAVAKENIKLSAVEMLLSGLLIIYTGKIYQAVRDIKQQK